MTRTPSWTRHPSALLAVAVLGLAALSGCIGDASEESPSPLSPTAILEADREERFAGEAFTFDATASYHPGGNVTRYHFDFGDGTKTTVTDEDAAANVTHTYETGGLYLVTLTVTAAEGTGDGNLSEAPQDTTNTTVAVHERHALGTRVAYAAPGGNATNATTNRSAYAFDTRAGATDYEADIDVQSMIPVGTTEVLLRVLDAEGDVVQEENVSVAAGENTTVPLKGLLAAPGEHVLEMVVTSGGAAFDGVLRVYYTAADGDR